MTDRVPEQARTLRREGASTHTISDILHVAPSTARHYFKDIKQPKRVRSMDGCSYPSTKLSAHELGIRRNQVAYLASRGHSYRSIGTQLGISFGAVAQDMRGRERKYS